MPNLLTSLRVGCVSTWEASLEPKANKTQQNILRPCFESPENHNSTTCPDQLCSNVENTPEKQKIVLLSRISHKLQVCWGSFAQGLPLSVRVSSHPLALEGFVLCAFLSSHTQPRLPKHPSDIPVGSNKPLTHESHSKPQLPVGPVQSSLVQANHLSDSTKGPTEQPQSHCHSSTLLRGHITPSLG